MVRNRHNPYRCWALDRYLVVYLIFASACSAAPTQTQATTPGTPTPTRTATLHALVSLVFVRDSEAASFVVPQDGQAVPEHGQVRTGAASSARLDFSDGSVVRMGQNTVLDIDQLGGSEHDPVTRLRFGTGALWISLTGGQMTLQTSLGLAGVRGSYAEFRFQSVADSAGNQDDVLSIACIEGMCTFDRGNGIVALGNLQQLVVSRGGRAIVGPSDLDASDVGQFVTNSPESSGVIPSLTAAAQTPSATPVPTNTVQPAGTPATVNTATPADTPTTPASDTPFPTATLQPSPTRTRPPVVILPTATPTDTLGPTDTALPSATATPRPPPPPPRPTATAMPAPSATSAPPPTATNPPLPTKTASRPPPPTKTASPVP